MNDPKPAWRINQSPRFTALQMGLYVAQPDGPRETTLRHMKYERIAPSLLYSDLNRAVVRFLTSPTRDIGHLYRCKEELTEKLANTVNAQARNNIQYELNALGAFERSLNRLEIAGMEITKAPHSGRRLDIEGVKINVRATAHIKVNRPRTVDLVGALIVDLAKGPSRKTEEALTRNKIAMTHAAILLHEYVENELGDDDLKPSRQHSMIFHSFSQEVARPPSAYKRSLRNIEAVCRQIAGAWPNITPPKNFDERLAKVRR